MRTEKPLVFESYDIDRLEDTLTRFRDNHVITEWWYIVHDQDTKEDGSPKKTHAHVCAIPCGQQDPDRLCALTLFKKEHEGKIVDSHVLINEPDKKKKTTNSVPYYIGYAIHDPKCPHTEGKHQYSTDLIHTSNKEWVQSLLDQWDNQKNEPDDAKAEKARIQWKQADDLIEQGLTDTQILMQLGISPSACTSWYRGLDRLRAEKTGYFSQAECIKLRDSNEALKAHNEELQKLVADLQSRLQIFHALEESPLTAQAFADLMKTSKQDPRFADPPAETELDELLSYRL